MGKLPASCKKPPYFPGLENAVSHRGDALPWPLEHQLHLAPCPLLSTLPGGPWWFLCPPSPTGPPGFISTPGHSWPFWPHVFSPSLNLSCIQRQWLSVWQTPLLPLVPGHGFCKSQANVYCFKSSLEISGFFTVPGGSCLCALTTPD